jgi:hypothetical protein
MRNVDPTTGRPTATDPRAHVRFTRDFFLQPGKFAHLTDPIERAVVRDLLATCIALTDERGGDGHVVLEDALALTGLPEEYGKTLILDGCLHQADHDCPRCPQPRLGHVYVHDLLEHNRSAEQQRRTAADRKKSGADGARARWAGHQPKPKGRPGRPRKHPKPDPVVAAEPMGQLALVPIEPADTQPVLQHPAETRARARRGRPARTEPRVFAPEVVGLCEYFADLRQRNDPDGKRDNITERWLNACRLMIEADGRKPEDIRKAITYCLNHEGHRLYVQSVPKLREDYAKLQNWARKDLGQQNRAGGRPGQPPAAVSVPGMNALYDDDYAGGSR